MNGGHMHGYIGWAVVFCAENGEQWAVCGPYDLDTAIAARDYYGADSHTLIKMSR